MALIHTTRARSALTPRPSPHYQKIGIGLYVGLRLLDAGAATWCARYRHPDTGKQVHRALGDLLSLPEPERFAYAAKAAQAFAQEINGGGTAKPGTVADACRKYVERQRVAKGDNAADAAHRMFKRLVYGQPIGDTLLSDLRPAQYAAWRDALVDMDKVDDLAAKTGDRNEALRRRRESANRSATNLRSALNMAYELGLVASDRGWKTVKQFKGTTGRRNVYLTREQRKALLAAAADEPEMAALIEAALLTCFRPGALAKLRVQDFHPHAGTVRVPASKTTFADVLLPTAAIKLFKRMSKNKLPTAPLLHRPDGGFWRDANDWNWRTKSIGERAGIPGLCLYHLRHTGISAMIERGVDVLTVARLARTSIDQIHRHYGHLHAPTARAQMDAAGVL